MGRKKKKAAEHREIGWFSPPSVVKLTIFSSVSLLKLVYESCLDIICFT